MSASPTGPSVEEIRSYLLHRMSETGRARFEAAYFESDALLDRIEEEEDHLVSDYVLGRLSEPERVQFERRLLGAPYYRQRVETTTRLNKKVRRPGLFERPRGRVPDPKGGFPAGKDRRSRRGEGVPLFPGRTGSLVAVALLAVLLVAAVVSALRLRREVEALRKAASQGGSAPRPAALQPAAPPVAIVLDASPAEPGPQVRRLSRPPATGLLLVLGRPAPGDEPLLVTLLDGSGRPSWSSGPRGKSGGEEGDLTVRVPAGPLAAGAAALLVGPARPHGAPASAVLVLGTGSGPR